MRDFLLGASLTVLVDSTGEVGLDRTHKQGRLIRGGCVDQRRRTRLRNKGGRRAWTRGGRNGLC